MKTTKCGRKVSRRAVLTILLVWSLFGTRARAEGGRVWNQSDPESVKRDISEVALEEGAIRVVLDDEQTFVGNIRQVDDESFVLETRASGNITVRFALVRSIHWTKLRATKADKIRSKARDLATHSGVVARLRLHNRPKLTGNVTEANPLKFVFVDQQTGLQQQLDYRDVERLSAPNLSPKLTASEILQDIGRALALPLMIPLMILSGWDGC